MPKRSAPSGSYSAAAVQLFSLAASRQPVSVTWACRSRLALRCSPWHTPSVTFRAATCTNAGIGAFATNGWSDSLTNGLNAFGGKTSGMLSAFLIETVLTAIFLFVIMGATDGRAPAGFAPIAIGLCLTLIHLISIPVTNTSVNPARSTAVAVFVGGAAIKQLWLFWVAPILGGVIGGIAYKCIAECKCCKK